MKAQHLILIGLGVYLLTRKKSTSSVIVDTPTGGFLNAPDVATATPVNIIKQPVGEPVYNTLPFAPVDIVREPVYNPLPSLVPEYNTPVYTLPAPVPQVASGYVAPGRDIDIFFVDEPVEYLAAPQRDIANIEPVRTIKQAMLQDVAISGNRRRGGLPMVF